MKKIIFEDENIVIVHQDGNSDYLLITFGDRVTLADGDRFSAEKPVTTNSINCIGFMAKNSNWYPKQSITAALDKVKKISSQFTSIIMYGGSMGGYAAIKYSSTFAATSVIAYIPQWSISPHDCGSNDKRYSSHYNSEMETMAICSNDVHGNVYVFVDPHFKPDFFHYKKIKDVYPSAKQISIYSANHAVTAILAGSSALKKIVESALRQDEQELVKSVAEIRRKSGHRMKILLERATTRHPLMVLKMYARLENVEPFCSDRSYKQIIINFLAAASGLLDEVEFYRLCARFTWAQAEDLKSVIFKNIPLNLTQTFHSTFLVYDILNENMCCVTVDEITRFKHYLPLSMTQEFGLLEINISGKRYSLSFKEKVIINRNPEQQDTSALLSYRKINDYYVISSGIFNLTSHPNGKIGFHVSHIKAWEKLHIISGELIKKS